MAVLAVTAALVLVWPTSPSLAGEAPAVVPASEIARRAAVGEPLDLADAVIDGDLDLRVVTTFARPLRCLRCRFTGSFRASDVVFERVVDVTGSSFEGPVALASVLRGGAHFDRARFAGPVTLAFADALDDVSFDGARFHGDFAFDRGRVEGGASFADARFFRDASFDGAQFKARADFTQAAFSGGSNFRRAVFGGAADFTLARFSLPADFDRAELRGGGSFRFATFGGEARFDGASAGGALDFDGARLHADGSFEYLVSSGSLSLGGVRAGAALFMERISVEDLRMDVATVDAVRGRNPRKDLLKLIEVSATARDELTAANRARFRRLSLLAEEKRGVSRLADRVVYRQVAGYLVRPLHPLLALAALLLVAGAVRALPAASRTLAQGARDLGGAALRALPGRRDGQGGAESRLRPGDRGAVSAPARPSAGSPTLLHRATQPLVRAAAILFRGVARSVIVAFRPKPRIEEVRDERVRSYLVAALRWAEFLTYKLLLAVLLLSLGNSNATIRQILETARSS